MTKKHLKIGFLAIALGFVTTSLVNAQQKSIETPKSSGFYVSVQGGYNLPMNKQTLDYHFEMFDETDTNTDTKYKSVPLSFGKGANFGLNIGYMFTSNIGGELGFNYLLGSKTTSTYKDEYTPTYSRVKTMSAKMMQFKPAMVFRTNFDKLSPYARVGLVIGVGSKIKMDSHSYDSDDGYTRDINWEFDGGTSLGMHGALGAEYAINNKIGVFGEVTGTGLNYAPKKGKMVTNTLNGVDRLPNMDIREKEVTFEDGEYNYYSSNKNEPSKDGKQYTPFSSIGLNLGVRFKF